MKNFPGMQMNFSKGIIHLSSLRAQASASLTETCLICDRGQESLLFARLWLGEAWEKGFAHVLRHEGSHVFRDLRCGGFFAEKFLVGLGGDLVGHVEWSGQFQFQRSIFRNLDTAALSGMANHPHLAFSCALASRN